MKVEEQRNKHRFFDKLGTSLSYFKLQLNELKRTLHPP